MQSFSVAIYGNRRFGLYGAADVPAGCGGCDMLDERPGKCEEREGAEADIMPAAVTIGGGFEEPRC